jgi:hypothetical protein
VCYTSLAVVSVLARVPAELVGASHVCQLGGLQLTVLVLTDQIQE